MVHDSGGNIEVREWSLTVSLTGIVSLDNGGIVVVRGKRMVRGLIRLWLWRRVVCPDIEISECQVE